MGQRPDEMKTHWVILLALLSIPGSAVAQDLEAGKRQFAALCSGCHGSDGGGGEHGPNIVDLGRLGPGRGGRESLTDVIKNGTESGMPAFRLPDSQIAALVAYLRDLRAPAADPDRSEVQLLAEWLVAERLQGSHAAEAGGRNGSGKQRTEEKMSA